MSRKILGLDIRHDSVSAVLIESSIKGTEIEAQAHVPISGQNEDGNNWVDSLETIVQKMDITGFSKNMQRNQCDHNKAISNTHIHRASYNNSVLTQVCEVMR